MKTKSIISLFGCDSQVVLIFILMLGNSLFLHSQSDTSWYRHYVMDSLYIMFPSGIEPCGNDAVLLISAVAEIGPPYNRSALLRIDDESGDILWNTRLVQNPVAEDSQILFPIRGIIRLQDGSFIVLVDTINEEGKSGFVVYRISADGSILWNQDYSFPGQEIIASTGGLAISPDSMSFAVSARRADIQNPSSSLIIYHINSQGDVINQFSVNTGLQFYWEVSPIAMLADSSFVVGFNLGIADLNAPKWLSHVSYEGEIINTHVAWDLGWWSDLKRHPTGQIVTVSQSFSGDWDNRETHGLRTTLYTPNLDTIWSHVYNNFEGPLFYKELDFPSSASFDPAGNILVNGDGSAFNGVRPAHFVMYDIDGNVEWIKRLGIRDDVAGYVQSIGGKIAFEPNSILLAGSISVNEMLLIRLDSSGCIIESDCGTDYLLNLNDEFQSAFIEFHLTPNPTLDEVIVTLTEDQFQSLSKPNIHIIDILGQIQVSLPLTDSRQQIELSFLPTGVYIVTLESKGSAFGSEKLIKW